MVYAFTEKEKSVINDYGYSVVEFKALIKKMGAFSNLWYEIIDKVVIAFEKVAKMISDAVDSIDLIVNDFCHEMRWQTSGRYKLTYILSKCTGIKRRHIWRFIRPLYLPRSNC